MDDDTSPGYDLQDEAVVAPVTEDDLKRAIAYADRDWLRRCSRSLLGVVTGFGLCVASSLLLITGSPIAGAGAFLVALWLIVASKAKLAAWSDPEVCLAQVLSDLQGRNQLPILIRSLNTGSPNARRLLRATVARQLSSLDHETAARLLDNGCWQPLMGEIARFRLGKDEADMEFEEFMIALLHTARVRLYLPALGELRWIPVTVYAKTRPRLARALTDTMTVLQAEAQRQAKAGVLLRPSEAPPNSHENLLTPARGAAGTESEQLLRSTTAE
jgi:hypothetical protein